MKKYKNSGDIWKNLIQLLVTLHFPMMQKIYIYIQENFFFPCWNMRYFIHAWTIEHKQLWTDKQENYYR